MRIRIVNTPPLRAKGRHVVYWMTAARRLGWNYGLQRAAGIARERRVPLVVLETLRCDDRWASDRLHAFVLDGMREHAAALRNSRVLYYPYLEREPGAGRDLLQALAAKAVAVVTDDVPGFTPEDLDVRLEAVDSNGLLPLAATERVFVSAYQFRRFLQKTELDAPPEPDPLAAPLVAAEDVVLKRWPRADLSADLASFPIDHAVAPATTRGGHAAAVEALRRFKRKLGSYAEDRNHPDEDATSGLSPWLRFGQISTHEVVETLAPGRPVFERKDGRKGEGAVDAFLDQLVTWRELGYNYAHKREDVDRYESLPAWARITLEKHAEDPRDPVYTLAEFEAAKTHDELWNAAQTQLVREGRLHNYLRMLWGKKILEWSATPREALATMIELNNKYALDGRDPNSYSGIFWCLGRYDRPWGPERPIFGKVRYMSSDAARRKLRLESYLSRYAI
ncbi:MAG TPA: deoxyribodipyrimidine photolyase [Planctomycetota bacterium]